jgi:hypothetical protein
MRKTFKTTILYWWRVISRFSQTLKRIIDIGGYIVEAIFRYLTVLAVDYLATKGLFSIKFVNDFTADWQSYAQGLSFLIIGLFVIFVVNIIWQPAEIDEEKQSEIDKLRKELNDYQENKKLRLRVNQGISINENAGGGLPRTTLMVDVINDEARMINDLEAHLSNVEQITEDLPDDGSYSHWYLKFRTKRLQWKNGKYMVDLIPGFPETSLKISELNCFSKEFMFIHEGNLAILPSLQKDALYRITIEFKGRLAGDNPDYKFFSCEERFICLPLFNSIEYLPEAANFPYLPAWLKRKLNIQNGSTQSLLGGEG